MNRKLSFTIAFLLALVIGAITLATQPELTNGWFISKTNAQTPQIPSHVLYDQVFRLTISFRLKAQLQQVTGEMVTTFPDYFKNEAGLTDQENDILQQVAIEFLQEVQPIDDRAAVLIAEAWEPFPDDIVPEGQHVSQPSELAGLQEERNALALSYRDRLNELLGSEKFDEFDAFVQDGFSSSFQSIQTPQN